MSETKSNKKPSEEGKDPNHSDNLDTPLNSFDKKEKDNQKKQKEENRYSLLDYIKSLKPLIFRHHPYCEKFEDHTFSVKGVSFCIGCFIGIPSAIIGVVLIYFLNLFLTLESGVLFIIGLILMSTFLLSPLKLTKYQPVKFAQKILFNLGAAFIFWWVIYLPNPLLYNLLFGFFVYMTAITFLNVYHTFSIFRKCKKCEFEMDWESCPGFKDIMDYINENELPNIYKFKK
jgi:hypothetical protein